MKTHTSAWARLVTVVALLLGAVPGQAQAPATATASAVLRADQPGPVVNRNIYGHFAEHLGRGIYEGIWVGPDSPIPNTRGIRNDVVAALKELNIPVLRWPGGCFADEYHWKDGIGPREKRPSMINTHWGGVVEDNSFGTHEFMDLVEQLGTDAYVTGNVGSGTAAGDDGVGRVHDLRRHLADGQPPAPERPREAVAPAVLRDRQRALGLRRQHAPRVLRRRVPEVQHLRQELRPQQAHLPHRGGRQRPGLQVDRGADERRRATDGRPVAPLLHAADGELGHQGLGDRLRRGPVVLDPATRRCAWTS